MALEQQQALAAAGVAGGLLTEVPPFLSELHGSFADLVQQLQKCVNWRRQGEARLVLRCFWSGVVVRLWIQA